MTPYSRTLDTSVARDTAHRVVPRVERLAGDIGVLVLGDAGDHPAEVRALLEAMRQLESTGALIIDVRESRDVHRSIAALLASWLFDTSPALLAGTYLVPTLHRQHAPLPTLSRYLGKPVLLVIGPDTGDVASEMARGLKRLRRVTVIGESPLDRFFSPNVPVSAELARAVAHLVALTTVQARRGARARLATQAAIVGARRELEQLRARAAGRRVAS